MYSRRAAFGFVRRLAGGVAWTLLAVLWLSFRRI